MTYQRDLFDNQIQLADQLIEQRSEPFAPKPATGPRAYFFEQGRIAATKYKTFAEAAAADEDRLTAYVKLDGHQLLKWEAVVLSTAYELGYKSARP